MRETTLALRLLLVSCASCHPTAPPPATAAQSHRSGGSRCIEYFDPHPSGYSNAVRVGRTVYIAGQLPFASDGTVAVGDPERQVRQVWENVRSELTAAGGSTDDIINTTTFITAREYGDAVEKVRLELFPKNAPTSSRIIVAGLACEECVVEINAVAFISARSDRPACN